MHNSNVVQERDATLPFISTHLCIEKKSHKSKENHLCVLVAGNNIVRCSDICVPFVDLNNVTPTRKKGIQEIYERGKNGGWIPTATRISLDVLTIVAWHSMPNLCTHIFFLLFLWVCRIVLVLLFDVPNKKKEHGNSVICLQQKIRKNGKYRFTVARRCNASTIPETWIEANKKEMKQAF